jgi:putative endonuclease
MELAQSTVLPLKGWLDLTKERLSLGKFGEDLALKEIKGLGYKRIIRNYRCPLGEIDLIATDGDTLVFIEVKTRKGRSLAYAKEAVNDKKRRQLSKVALFYMKSHNLNEVRARFDVVAVSLAGVEQQVEVVRNAFELAY